MFEKGLLFFDLLIFFCYVIVLFIYLFFFDFSSIFFCFAMISLLERMKGANVSKWFCGHFHRNAGIFPFFFFFFFFFFLFLPLTPISLF